MARHSEQTSATGMHGTIAYVFASAAARLAAARAAADVGKVARDADSGRIWMLRAAPADWVPLDGGGVDVPFTTAVPFRWARAFMPETSVTGPLTFSADTAGAMKGARTSLRLTADGTNTPNFGALKRSGSSKDWINVAGTLNRVEFEFDGSDYRYTVQQDQTELEQIEDLLSKQLFSWMRADYRSEAGGKVTAFGEKVKLVSEGALYANARSVDAAHSFAQATAGNQVASIAPSALFNGKDAATFAGGQWYTSTLPLANWRFLHDGSGCEVCMICAPTIAGTHGLFATLTTNPGVLMYANASGNLVGQVNNAAGALWTSPAMSAASVMPVNSATAIGYAYKEGSTPEGSLYRKGASLFGRDTDAAPSSSNPNGSLTIGAQHTGGFPMTGLVCDLLVANRVDATLHAALYRYAALRYGIT